MARGFLSGALVGGVVSLGAGSVASVMAPLHAPMQNLPPVVSDRAPAGGDAPQVAVAVAETPAPSVDTAVATQTAPRVTAPQQDTVGNLAQTTAPTANVPIIGEVAELAPPADQARAGAIALAAEDPVLPNPLALAPMVPQGAEAVTVDTAPAARPVPAPIENADLSEETADEIVAEALAKARKAQPQSGADDAEMVQTTVGSDSTGTSETTEAKTGAPVTESAGAETDPVSKEAEQPGTKVDADRAETAVTQNTEDAAAGTSESQADPAPQTAQTETTALDLPKVEAPGETDTTADAGETAQVAALAPEARPRIGTPATTLTDRATNVTVNRLVKPAPDVARVEQATIITDSPSGDDMRPIAKFAQAFANPEGKPLMGIVLIDDGSGPIAGAPGIAALRSFPYTLSFAVDSTLPDAAERAALYRSEGFEVLAMVDLPQGAQPVDVETTLAATLSQMPEVVGLLEGTGEGVQASREVADQVTAVLAQSGHGLLTQSKGLNTMPKLARKEGVPADTVFRDFDSAGQTATVIRRFLDQAAFKAGQEGGVVMLGRLRPDTISALLLWGLQDRAGKVALAPISAVLTREAP